METDSGWPLYVTSFPLDFHGNRLVTKDIPYIWYRPFRFPWKPTRDQGHLLRKDVDVDRFYVALYSALEQTHCACLWFQSPLYVISFPLNFHGNRLVTKDISCVKTPLCDIVPLDFHGKRLPAQDDPVLKTLLFDIHYGVTEQGLPCICICL